MNMARQPLLIAFPTLLLLLGGVLVRKLGGSFTPEQMVGFQTLPAEWIGWFQSSYPRISWGVWLLCHSVVALTLGRMAIRHNLYAGSSLLAVPLYGVAACGIFVGDNYLASALAALILARAMRNFCVACRNGYAFSALFRGALYLGLLPLITLSAWPLLMMLPLITFLFKRTLREWIVALTGLVLPFGALLYIHWAVTAERWVPLERMSQGLAVDSGISLFADASILLVVQLVVMLAAVLWALFYYLSDIYVATSKVRAILTAHLWLLVLCFASLALPGASVGNLALLAIPMAILLPFLFVRLKRSWANCLYALMLLLAVVRLFVG